MNVKPISLLLMAFILSAFLLTACGQSDIGEVKIKFSAFDQTKPPSLIKASGLSNQEAFGIWSQAKTVSFEFDKPLPKKFSLSIRAYALGPNVGKAFKASSGSDVQSFTLPAHKPEVKTVTLTNSSKSKVLTIEVPEPVRPRDLQINNDERSLGLAFYEMSINPL